MMIETVSGRMCGKRDCRSLREKRRGQGSVAVADST